MQLDWSTFVFEVINFLILVWLLKRFLYQPVLNVVAQRRQKIEAELAAAAARQEEADALKKQFEARLADWEQEKRGALDALEQQIGQERAKRLKQLDDELEQQRLRQQARDQQQQGQWRSQAEAEALQLGSSFAARLLQGLAGAELEQRLQQLFVEQLAALPERVVREMSEAWQGGNARIEVVSAHPLEESQQRLIRQALERKLGLSHGQWHFSQDERLIAGLRVAIGGWMLQANLQDELRFFTEAAYG